jgi:hypothetical protein
MIHKVPMRHTIHQDSLFYIQAHTHQSGMFLARQQAITA